MTPVEIEDDTFEPGTIINQSPPPLTPVPGGTSVIVEVAVTPTGLPVPDVIGLNLAGARQTLRQEGFTSSRVLLDADGNFLDSRNGNETVVLRQDPAPGTLLDAGGNVNIVLEVLQ